MPDPGDPHICNKEIVLLVSKAIRQRGKWLLATEDFVVTDIADNLVATSYYITTPYTI